MTVTSTPRRRCVVPDCTAWTDRGLLCGPHYADVRAGRLQVKPGRCRVCGTVTKAEAYTYCETHHRVRRGREQAAVVPDELRDWFTHHPTCPARDGAQLALFAQLDGATAGLTCRACHRTVGLRGGREAALARRELLAVGALVDAPPHRAARPAQADGRYVVDCSCGCGNTLKVATKKPGRYYIEGHQRGDRGNKQKRSAW